MDDKEVLRFDVLWKGWELDNDAWIMERENGSRYLIMTNHGGKYEANKSEIESRIAVYEDIIKQSKEALKALTR